MCFCFEEQRVGAGESIDLPVLFFIEPSFAEDPAMHDVRSITLSYTWFKSNSSADDLDDDDE